MLMLAAACSSDHRTVMDATGPGPGDGPTDSGSTADAEPTGGTCGGLIAMRCETTTAYCDYPDDSCGTGDQTGTCKPKPDICPEVFRPTCGCDGKIYSNACAANQAGVDTHAGGCTPPTGMFACGDTFCDLSATYCLHDPSAAEPYQCKLLPNCTDVSCACLTGQPCGDTCAGTAAAGLTLSCP